MGYLSVLKAIVITQFQLLVHLANNDIYGEYNILTEDTYVLLYKYYTIDIIYIKHLGSNLVLSINHREAVSN